MINKALSNVQIKTDILTVEKLYRPSHEYGFLRETDTVKDYLDLVRKNRSSRFPVINQHQVVVGVVTMETLVINHQARQLIRLCLVVYFWLDYRQILPM